ncbi:sodium:solute symporter family protein, partial [Desulfovibrio sp. OttesenSCG-928-M14]|nr:sodium:solute symporter family protein [Desulfovibrio sp. OttesenSCG-928-M14]
GLGHSMGMQVQFVTLGCVWFGCWMVYRFVAWPTRQLQKRLGASTPLELVAKGYDSPALGKYCGLISGVLILVYCSAVFKGGALILTSAVALTETQALVAMVGIVAISVLWGGLRAVLYTEALQGLIMALGVLALLFGALKYVGGVSAAFEALAALPPTPQANNGFLAMSSGAGGMNIIFLMLITSVGVWAQPQLIQRHFALKSKEEATRIIPMVMLIIGVLLGGALFVGGISQLILGPDAISPDKVIPTIALMVMPEAGIQLFALAIVSASLSTASALLHVSCATLGQDVFGKKLEGWKWRVAVLCGSLVAGAFALYSSSIIAIICATSWTLVAAAMWAPYIALLLPGLNLDKRSGWISSLSGTAAALLWYFLGYAPTSMQYFGISAGGLLGHVHPMLVGILCSSAGLMLGLLLGRRVRAQLRQKECYAK